MAATKEQSARSSLEDREPGEQGRRVRVLQVASSDLTVAKLLLPLVDRLTAEGYSTAIACSDGPFARELKAQGYELYTVPIARTVKPKDLLRSTSGLVRLMRKERFDVVHVHTPVAAAVGRIAARLTRVPKVVYTAHGFYFHERMSPKAKWLTVNAERAMGRLTDVTFTQSAEDAESAVELGIARAERVVCISNGVDLVRFRADRSTVEARESFGLSADDAVVGFVGRLVGEKGILDLLRAMRAVAAKVPRAMLLIAGDANTAGDRDRKTAEQVREILEAGDLPYRVVFTGFIDDIERMMSALDVFVLPSYREGMPRSIIEAMASGKPVVATNIRGCREEVIHGETGLLYEPGDVQALSEAITGVLADRPRAAEMGAKGRLRAEERFDEQQVLERQVVAYRELLGVKS